jgi:hypothetical protein
MESIRMFWFVGDERTAGPLAPQWRGTGVCAAVTVCLTGTIGEIGYFSELRRKSTALYAIHWP